MLGGILVSACAFRTGIGEMMLKRLRIAGFVYKAMRIFGGGEVYDKGVCTVVFSL